MWAWVIWVKTRNPVSLGHQDPPGPQIAGIYRCSPAGLYLGSGLQRSGAGTLYWFAILWAPWSRFSTLIMALWHLWSIVALQQLHDLSKVNRVWKLLFFNLRFGLGALILLLGILFFALLSEEADFGPPICSRVVAGHSLLRFKRAECASFLTMRRCQLFKERCWTSIQNIDSNQHFLHVSWTWDIVC